MNIHGRFFRKIEEKRTIDTLRKDPILQVMQSHSSCFNDSNIMNNNITVTGYRRMRWIVFGVAAVSMSKIVLATRVTWNAFRG